jgi:hypothetical protein
MSAEHVELLKKARSLIKSGDNKFICFALREADDRKYSPVFNALRGDIIKGLEGQYTLEYWIQAKLNTRDSECFYTTKGRAKLKRTRLAWIDAMIEYWRDKP